MQKVLIGLISLLLTTWPVFTHAQTVTPETEASILKREQRRLLRYIHLIATDSNIVDDVTRFIEPETDTIINLVMANTALADSEKTKAIQSLAYFMTEVNANIHEKKIEIYDIPRAMGSYKLLLKALVEHAPLSDLLVPLSEDHSRLLATCFRRYDEGSYLNDIALYKSTASSPDHILQFVKANPRFRFSDSLLVSATIQDPVQMASYLQNDPQLLRSFRSKKNIYLKQVALLAEDKNASKLLPFTVELAEGKLTEEDILTNGYDITSYFQLLVNTLKDEVASPHPSLTLQVPLRNAIKEQSLLLYVNNINALHGSPDSLRFASVKDLRTEDIYYVITSCEQELFTSSYLGLYRRLLQQFTDYTAHSIFALVQYDNFLPFMRLAANYNTLTDFLTCMPPESAAEILKKFLTGIEADTDSGLEKAMDIADSFTGLSADSAICETIKAELKSNLDRCDSAKSYFGVRLYGILLQVFEIVRPGDSTNQLWTYLGNHDVLPRQSLQNQDGDIIELVLFYGDKDGVSSFKNFMNLFKNTRKWKVTKNKKWVTIHSLSGQPITVYANLPLDEEQGLDLEAQDSLSDFIKQKSQEPVILVHRGHSYHVAQSLKRMQPSVKLAILGSCGGYNGMLSAANISPDAQIIISKKTGSKSINDPMIEVINETLQSNNDLVWTEIWEKMAMRLSNDQVALNLFDDYLPPKKNVSLFVLKLFNFSSIN